MSTTRFVLLLVSTLAVAGAPLSYRTGVLSVNAALALLAVGLLPLLWVLAAGLLVLVRRGPGRLDRRTGASLVLAAAVCAVPLATVVPSIGAPPIHDITTDVEDPPRFDAVVAARGAGSNPVEYRGPELAATQRAAYPDIQPVRLERDPGDLADLALAVAEDLGWQVVAVESDPSRGVLIEATDTTFWFGFQDDVAVRLRSARDLSGGTTVDVRSISRIGVGDLGANAARIQEFVVRLRAAARRR